MKVDIILHESNKGWIIEKMANRLNENLLLLGINSRVVDLPSIDSDIIHWMHYLNIPTNLTVNSTNTMLVTHVDEIDKLEKLEFLIHKGIHPIFLSAAHALEVSASLKIKNNFRKILPGSDLAVFNKIKFIINSNSYPDNRKNDNYLIKLSKDLKLTEAIFIFCGKRWEEVGINLREAGAEVYIYSKAAQNYPDYPSLNQMTKDSDIFIYMGFDEGSIGALDAYLLDRKLIVSDQGFHKEMLDKNVNLFKNYNKFKELIEISIENHVSWQKEKMKWSWGDYAKNHLNVWQELGQISNSSSADSGKIYNGKKITRLYNLLRLSSDYRNYALLFNTLKRLRFRKLINFMKKGNTK
jgi:hypothetical protein